MFITKKSHETVVNALEREKADLALALQEQQRLTDQLSVQVDVAVACTRSARKRLLTAESTLERLLSDAATGKVRVQ